MAYHSQSLGRSLSVTSLEGIQVRLGEHFRPLEKVVLPVGYKEPNPSATLNASQYSFKTERRFLQFLEDKRESDAAKEESRQRAKEEQLAAAATSPVQLPNGILQPTNVETGPSEMRNQSIAPMVKLGVDIMMPVPLTNSNSSSSSNLPVASRNRNQNFDLADFENNASDPFESTELETIDDMEELRSMLAFTHVPAQPGSVTIEQPLHSTDISSEDFTLSDGNETAEVNVQTNQVTYKLDKKVTKPQTLSAGNDGLSAHVPNGQVVLPDTAHHAPSGNPDPFARSPLPPISLFQSDNAMETSPGDGPCRLIARGPATDHSVQSPRGRSPPPSYCAHDFTQRITSPVISPVELPPSYPQSLSRYTPLPPSPHQSRTNSVDHGPADPVFVSMGAEDRNFVLTIVGMGFPQARTARAVKQLGHDDRLVVEWLCAMDHLCSQGFQEDKVELALSLHDNDTQKAQEFLMLCQRFEELGFKSEDIRRELIVHGNNEDTVLNVLTAKS